MILCAVNMATKPFLQLNQRLNDLYRKNSAHAYE
jgi:hypothetical protein